MGTFTYSTNITLTTSDGLSAQTKQDNVPGNAKTILDESLSAGVVNLTPLLANLTTPAIVYIFADGNGFQFAYDGLAVMSKATTFVGLQFFPTPTGPAVLSVTLVGGVQRLRVFAIGT